MEALGRAGFSTEKSKFDEFLAGFNQAGQRFVLVDVGAGKENADSKLKGVLIPLSECAYYLRFMRLSFSSR